MQVCTYWNDSPRNYPVFAFQSEHLASKEKLNGSETVTWKMTTWSSNNKKKKHGAHKKKPRVVLCGQNTGMPLWPWYLLTNLKDNPQAEWTRRTNPSHSSRATNSLRRGIPKGSRWRGWDLDGAERQLSTAAGSSLIPGISPAVLLITGVLNPFSLLSSSSVSTHQPTNQAQGEPCIPAKLSVAGPAVSLSFSSEVQQMKPGR